MTKVKKGDMFAAQGWLIDAHLLYYIFCPLNHFIIKD